MARRVIFTLVGSVKMGASLSQAFVHSQVMHSVQTEPATG